MRTLCILVFACLSYSQVVNTFEAASIHPNESGRDNFVINLGNDGRLTATNANLKQLIRSAWGVQADQIVGGPKWLETDRYDIEAKTLGRITGAQEQPLMQNLLTDRFKLKVHREKRELTVYGLEVAKPGLIKQSESSGSQIRNNRGPGRNQISVVRIGMNQFAGMLGSQLGRIVMNKTSLAGDFDFTLTWDPEGNSDSGVPSLFAALQEQMGLKLDSQKAMMDVLVIDSAEKASEN